MAMGDSVRMPHRIDASRDVRWGIAGSAQKMPASKQAFLKLLARQIRLFHYLADPSDT
jgi:hypothetical protein